MPKVKIAEYSKREVFTPLTLSQVVQNFFPLVISLLVCNKVNGKRSNVSPGTSSSSTSSVCVGTCAPSVAAEKWNSKTATQLQVHSCQDFHAKVPICMLLRLTIPSQKWHKPNIQFNLKLLFVIQCSKGILLFWQQQMIQHLRYLHYSWFLHL